MDQLLEEQRETWGTRGGFVLAAVGSAVGLGNLWGFPYKIYTYGGGAFLIPYIVAMFCIGIPMLILEFSLGHLTQRAAPDAFRRCNPKLEFVGWWGILLGFVIITYYPVILAYCFSYIWYSIQGIFNGGSLPWAGEGIEGVEKASSFFADYLTKGDKVGPFQIPILIPLILAWIVMYFCIFRGVKLVGKIVWLTVPLPWIMLCILAVRGLTLPGSMKGLVYFLDPVWSELAEPSTWRYAFGQVFFSLSLAFGVMITYSSFLHRKSDINNNAAIIGIADFATSFIAGIAIFATIGGMAYISEQSGNPVAVDQVVKGGPGLAFEAFPYALAQLPGSAWWSLIFFFTLVTLGIDSAFSITESVLAGIVDKTGWRRSIVLPVMSLIGLAFGLIYVTSDGINWLGAIDGFVNGTWGIAFLGLLECIALGWFYRVDTLRRHANERSDWKLHRWWNYAIRIFIPIVLGTLFLWSLYDDFTTEQGFLRNPDGQWIITNCVGLAVVAAIPVFAILLSLIKSPYVKLEIPDEKPTGHFTWQGDKIALCLALLASVLVCLAFTERNYTSIIYDYSMIFGFAFAIMAVIIANYSLEKYDISSKIKHSNFVASAGIIATIDISALIAITLIKMTAKVTDTATDQIIADEKLSGISYIILVVVFLLIVVGLGWCFYRALTAGTKDEPIQPDDEV